MDVELGMGTLINGYYVIAISDLVLEIASDGQFEELKKCVEAMASK